MIEFIGISKKYNKKLPYAVENINFMSNNMDPVGIIGSNGAGKTTLFMMATGLARPTSGDIIIAGHSILNNLHQVKLITGLFTEKLILYPILTVKEVIKYFMGIYNIKIQYYDHWSRMFNIHEFENKKIEELSTGMLKKVMLLISLLNSPKVLFLDEPFSGLDPVTKEELSNIIKELYNEHKVKILISSHDLYETQPLIKEVIIMEKGKIIEQGIFNSLVKKYSMRKQIKVEYVKELDVMKKYFKNIYSESKDKLIFAFSIEELYNFMLCENREKILDIISNDMSLENIYEEVRKFAADSAI